MRYIKIQAGGHWGRWSINTKERNHYLPEILQILPSRRSTTTFKKVEPPRDPRQNQTSKNHQDGSHHLPSSSRPNPPLCTADKIRNRPLPHSLHQRHCRDILLYMGQPFQQKGSLDLRPWRPWHPSRLPPPHLFDQHRLHHTRRDV